MIKTIASLTVISMMVWACNNGQDKAAERKDGYSAEPKTETDSLYKAVMDGHDIGMAKMSALKKYNGAAQAKIDSVQKLPANKQDKTYLQEVMTLQQQLVNAENGMNEWMGGFNLDSTKSIGYLKSELQKVTIVRDNILSSLSKADSLLKK
ncbi:MAG: viral A-type inclusion protein [Chitinophagaceae bacterium]|nr:viral A-type inclusion protein [Chitinophagaceae bacterium]